MNRVRELRDPPTLGLHHLTAPVTPESLREWVRMFCHLVLFKFGEDVTPTIRVRFEQALSEMLTCAHQALNPQLLRDLGYRQGHPRSYDIGFRADFESAEELHDYLADDPHRTFLHSWVNTCAISVATLQFNNARPA